MHLSLQPMPNAHCEAAVVFLVETSELETGVFNKI